MTNTCTNCGSENLRNKGYRSKNDRETLRYKCNDCGVNMFVAVGDVVKTPKEEAEKKPPKVLPINPPIDLDESYDGLLITSCLNDTKIFTPFWENLVAYAKGHNYKLVVIKNKYKNPSALGASNDVTYPAECVPYFLDTTMRYRGMFKVIGDCNIQATASHPLTGIDGISEGITTIVGHPVVQMKSMPVMKGNKPIILQSTGSVSLKGNYSASKAGYRASFHHSYAAVVIDIDKAANQFYVRHVSGDKNGTFYDLDEKWENGEMSPSTIEAIYLGDEHVVFKDESVSHATFNEDNGIVHSLRPKFIIRGDVLDAKAISHHEANNFFARWKKHNVTNMASISDELDTTIDYLYATTPKFSTSLVINGNHEQHLDKWLNIADPKQDMINAKIYHKLMWLKLDDMEVGGGSSAFELYHRHVYSQASFHKLESVLSNRVKKCEEGTIICGINVSQHGDKGSNGARGGIQGFSKLGEKVIVGHSHSPAILGGAYMVGTSSIMNLDYTSGASSWLHCHAIIYPNGKRQLITIINGKWRS